MDGPQGFRETLARRLGYPENRGAIAQAAEATGIPGNVISRWLDEKKPMRPSPRNLERLAPYMGVSYAELLGMVYKDRAATAIAPASPPRAVFNQKIYELADEMFDAVSGTPRKFWWSILEATFGQAVMGARAMAQMMARAEAEEHTSIANAPGSADTIGAPSGHTMGEHGSPTDLPLGYDPTHSRPMPPRVEIVTSTHLDNRPHPIGRLAMVGNR